MNLPLGQNSISSTDCSCTSFLTDRPEGTLQIWTVLPRHVRRLSLSGLSRNGRLVWPNETGKEGNLNLQAARLLRMTRCRSSASEGAIFKAWANQSNPTPKSPSSHNASPRLKAKPAD